MSLQNVQLYYLFPQEIHHFVQCPFYLWVFRILIEAVLPTADDHQAIVYALLGQRLRHLKRLLEGHIAVLIAVQQKRRRVARLDVIDRAEGEQLFSFGQRTVATHSLRPDSLLATIEVELIAALPANGFLSTSDTRIGFFPGDGGVLLTIVGTRLAIPVSQNIAISHGEWLTLANGQNLRKLYNVVTGVWMT